MKRRPHTYSCRRLMLMAPLWLLPLLSPFDATSIAQTPSPAGSINGTAATPAPLGSPAPTPAVAPSAPPFNPSLPPPPAVSSLPSQPSSAPTPARDAPGTIRLNFQNASLADVLSYLSSAAGFIILQEAPVTGTVSVVSAQPVSADEAVDLLNAVLVEKGYVAVRSGRILKIVSRVDAEKRDLPVMTGSDPEKIPRKDNLVTQILPVRYADVTKLIDNISPLLPPTAKITSNASSNAIVLTDTQTDIHRIAEIIRALDTSISGISTIHVYPLRFADAKALADIITQLFTTDAQKGQNQQNQGFNLAALFGRPGGPNGGGRPGGQPNQPESEARQAASRVVAVADDQSNSIVVSAPEEYLPAIASIIEQLDTNSSDLTETRIFVLEHADANELTNILLTIYSDAASVPSAQGGQRGNQGGNQQRPGGNAQQNNQSQRALAQARVAIVPDPRTNSVIVSASHETLAQVAVTVERLDSSSAKKQHVHVYTLGHADPDNVASILKGMFTVDGSASSNPQPSLSRLPTRTSQGASSNISDTLNTSSTNNRGSR